MPGIYDDVGFDAYGAGREARNQLNNVQAFGRGVKQVASGVAEVPGKTWDGMNAAAAPLLDRQFDAMAAQGNAIRGAGANFVRGFNGPADAPYAEDAPRIAPSRAALPAPAATQRPDDIPGSAARIQAANPRGSQGVPQMARTLAQESQQRFAPQQGVEGSIGVDGFMRQLQNIRALGQMDTPAGPGILGDPDAQDRANAAMGEKWAREDRDRQFRSVLGGSGADARARMGAYTSYANAQNGADVQRQNAVLGYQGGRERDASAERIAGSRDQAAFGLEGMRGKNQLAAEGMRGANQLAATRMQGENQFGVEGMRRAGRMDEIALQGDNQLAVQDARQQTEAPWRTSQAGWYDAQTRKLNDETDQGASQVGRLQKLTAMYGRDFALPPDEARRAALKDILGADRAARMANGGVVGYAEGGGVAPAPAPMSRAQQLLADMDAKYGKTAGNAPAPAPQPAPMPPPVPQPQGVADKFRGYFGATDARMKQNGLAFGGAVPAQDIPGGQAVAQAVAGRQVFGQSDGSGRDDALPAVIDGERPAALTSGEFVWPVNAVKFYGMDKLNKMLAAAEKGMASHGDTA
jgi:hypothetical protein